MRVDFYHLERSLIEQILPVLAEKAYSTGKRTLIKTALINKANAFDSLLWTYKDEAWLPHGLDNDDFAADEPILIATHNENKNNAVFLMLTDGGNIADVAGFERCFNLFDGGDETAVQKARQLWKDVVAQGHEAYYWQQSSAGKWEMKASKNTPE